MDLSVTLFYLSDLESELGKRYWKVNPIECEEVLTRLRDKGVIDVFYWFSALDFTHLLSRVYFYLEGSENQVCSVTNALLKYLPTSLARITDRGRTAHIISRIPANEKLILTELVSQAAKSTSLNLNYLFPSAHRNYQTDLYQRLLNPDGTWNNDISAFLSQIRSVPKSVLDEK